MTQTCFLARRGIRAVFFDLYGTLVDIHTDENRPGFWARTAAFYTARGASWTGPALRRAYEALCAAETARLEARTPGAQVEIDLEPIFRALFVRAGADPTPALTEAAARFFRARSTTHLRAYAGARTLLRRLGEAGCQVVLLSNAQSCFTRPELETLGLADCFDEIFISSEVGFKKPDPRFFRAALGDLDPARCLMVGNDPVCDVGGARAVGMDAVYIHSALSPQPAPGPELPAVLRLPAMDLKALDRLLLGEGRGSRG